MSRISLRSLSIATLLVAAPFAAQAQNVAPNGKPVPSWYLGLAASVNFVSDASVTEQGVALPRNGTLGMDDGYGFTGAIGYRPRNTNSFMDNLRFEAQTSYFDNDISNFAQTNGMIGIADDGIQMHTVMANLYIDMNLGGPWRPYIGGGVGMGRAFVDSMDDDDTVLAYQGMAGLYYTFPSMPAAEIGFGYRYLGTSNPQYTDPTTRAHVEMEYDAHIVEVGTRLYF